MTTPKLHHYVPQFYLRRFLNAKDRLWIWDKTSDKAFETNPRSIAAENKFYWLHEFEELGRDPATLEKQLSDLEGQAALVTEQWLDWIPQLSANDKVPIPEENKKGIARYIAIQFLRTADRKDILSALYQLDHPDEVLTPEKQTRLHTELLWDQKTLELIEEHIAKAIWVFGVNRTETPFWTSDNPVAFKTANHKMWIKIGFVSKGTYVVFPLSPSVVLYCHERNYWKKISQFDCTVSPVQFTDEMVEHENAGQVFMATRFVMSSVNDFRFAREFASTIGTDKYAAKDWDEGLPDFRPLLDQS